MDKPYWEKSCNLRSVIGYIILKNAGFVKGISAVISKCTNKGTLRHKTGAFRKNGFVTASYMRRSSS